MRKVRKLRILTFLTFLTANFCILLFFSFHRIVCGSSFLCSFCPMPLVALMSAWRSVIAIRLPNASLVILSYSRDNLETNTRSYWGYTRGIARVYDFVDDEKWLRLFASFPATNSLFLSIYFLFCKQKRLFDKKFWYFNLFLVILHRILWAHELRVLFSVPYYICI